MKFRVAIPSYKRPELLQEKTLAYLRKTNMDMSRVDVFVANKEELKAYKKANKIKDGVNFILAVPTLKGKRAFIRKYYKEGEKIVSIDDDLKAIFNKVTDKIDELQEDFNDMVERGFKAAIENKTKLWGIGPVKNTLFTKFSITNNLKFIMGTFFGMIIDHDPELTTTLEAKEDYERSILYFIKFGGITRLNQYSIYTAYAKNKGGLMETRSTLQIIKECVYLLKKYPQYTDFKNGKTRVVGLEIVLKDKTVMKKYADGNYTNKLKRRKK